MIAPLKLCFMLQSFTFILIFAAYCANGKGDIFPGILALTKPGPPLLPSPPIPLLPKIVEKLGPNAILKNDKDLFDLFFGPNAPQDIMGIIKGPLSISNIKALCPKNAFFSDMNPLHKIAVMQATTLLLLEKSAESIYKKANELEDVVNPKAVYLALTSALYSSNELRKIQSRNFPNILPAFEMPERFFNTQDIAKHFNQSGNQNNDTCYKIDEKFGEDNGEENNLWYYREDMFLNTHHWYWHQAYPIIDLVKTDRRGELFYYLHSQFTARYKVERLTNKMASLVPFDISKETVITEGYNAHLTESNSNRAFVDRPPNATVTNLKRVLELPDGSNITAPKCNPIFCSTIEETKLWKERLQEAITSKSYKSKNGTEVSLSGKDGLDMFVNLLEASTNSDNPAYYGFPGYHANGHLLSANIMDNEPTQNTPVGVMGDTSTSIRDPLFYRWHGFVDDIIDEFKSSLPPYQPDNGEYKLEWPGVVINNLSVISSGENEINKLRTLWNSLRLNVNRGLDLGSYNGSVPLCIKHLDHESFSYNLDITREPSVATEKATVRIFMAPRYSENGTRFSMEEQRRFFISLDAFAVDLKVGNNRVTRRSEDSALTLPWTKSFIQLQTLGIQKIPSVGQGFCGCGWPHHLLLPKGTTSGAQFDLFAIVTNGMEDAVQDDTQIELPACKTPYIVCGVPNRKYPDSKPMGYPFDRKLFSVPASLPPQPQSYRPPSNLDEFVSFATNMATTQVVITHKDVMTKLQIN